MRDDDTSRTRPQAAAGATCDAILDESRWNARRTRTWPAATAVWACSRKGVCCDCIAYHLKSRELPACAFPADAERTYDRTFEHFARLVEQGKV